MSGNKAMVELSWKPNVALFSSTGKEKCPQADVSALYKSNSQLMDSLSLAPNDPQKLSKLIKKQEKDTAWFDMPAPTFTPELKMDLQLLMLQSAKGPKRRYKKGDSKSKALPKYYQVGTMIDPTTEFYPCRRPKKESKATLADEYRCHLDRHGTVI